MAPATERITVLMSQSEKSQLVSRAHRAGLSVSAFIRQAADSYYTKQDESFLCSLLNQLNQATERAEQAIDETLEYIHESNLRIAEMESRAPATRHK
jgi:DNA-binding transcriptional regulator GbsR (MarR family)